MGLQKAGGIQLHPAFAQQGTNFKEAAVSLEGTWHGGIGSGLENTKVTL